MGRFWKLCQASRRFSASHSGSPLNEERASTVSWLIPLLLRISGASFCCIRPAFTLQNEGGSPKGPPPTIDYPFSRGPVNATGAKKLKADSSLSDRSFHLELDQAV